MSLPLSITCGISGGGQAAQGVMSYAVENEPLLDVSLAIGTNTQVNIAIFKDLISAFFLLSDVDMTIKTNSTGSPGNTWNLKAGEPFFWWSTMLYANPVSADVTKFYCTQAAAARLRAWVAQDSTP